jgi:hypothetical protein
VTEPERAPADEARAFAGAFRSFLEWVHEDHEGRRSPLVALVQGHLGDRVEESVLGVELPVFEQVNLQAALDVWTVAAGRTVATHGVAIPPHYQPPSLQNLVHGEGLGPVRLSAPDLVDLPSGPDRTTACLRRAVLLVEDVRGRYVVMVSGPERHQEPVLAVEVAGLATPVAQEVLRELAELRQRLNVYRGQVLELAAGHAGMTISFPVLAVTAREDVVLPEQTLRRVERHTLDVVMHRDALREAGQHLKRGLLLFGPPGTGKTHTTRYVVQQLRGSTVLMLSGQSLHAVGMVTQMARDLQPAVIVLEDVDLVAEDRGFGPGANPVLFSLLDAMDGAASDADLLFLLTTNRADLLEPALAARPGRVDVAVEITLPDPDARRRLFAVYTRGLPLALSEADIDDVVARTEGVTASFVKELVRRSVLEALTAGQAAGEPLTAEVVSRALDDLLDSSQAVTRALLGVGTAGAPAADGGRTAGGHRGVGWMGHGPAGTGAYGSTLGISYDD